MVSNAHVDANSFIVQCAEQCSAVLTVYVSLCCPFVGLAVSCKRLQSFLLASFSPADAFVWQLKVFPANLCHYKKYKETRVLFIMCWLALSSSSSSSFAAATAQFRILNHKIIHFVFLHCIAISSHVWKTFILRRFACVRVFGMKRAKRKNRRRTFTLCEIDELACWCFSALMLPTPLNIEYILHHPEWTMEHNSALVCSLRNRYHNWVTV